MKRSLYVLAVAMWLAVPVQGALFFSEYIEGSSNNKALEIFNNGPAAVNLAANNVSVQMFFNGSTSAGLTINLTGVVASGDVYVLAQSSADPAILAQADQTNGAGWFNGNDAVTLNIGTTVLDSIGQIGNNPGTEWGTGLTSTADNTLRRKLSIVTGDTNPNDAFDPSIEWDGFAQNTFDGLGAHGGSVQPAAPNLVLPDFGQKLTLDFTGFTGAGLSPNPLSGQLDSDNFVVLGLSDGDTTFGGTFLSGDYARGTSAGGTITGGIYAFDHGGGDVGLGVQPSGADFTPGEIILRLENTTGSNVDALDVMYDVWVYNDADRSNTFEFAFSTDGTTFTDLSALDVLSDELADVMPEWEKFTRMTRLTGLNLAPGDFLYLRWLGDDFGGGGSRDEFALDNVMISHPVPEPATLAALGLGIAALTVRRRRRV